MVSSTSRIGLSALLATSIVFPSFAAECGFSHSFTRPDEGGTTSVKVYQGAAVAALGGVKPLLFITSLKVNTDGTKISYHVDDVTGRRCATNPAATPCAINNIANSFRNHNRPVSDFEAVRDAGYPLPRTWQVLHDQIIEKSSATGKPCVTPDGYLVSMTADVAVAGGFGAVGNCDQAKWIDALTMPALVLPKGPTEFRTKGMRKRSLMVAVSRSSTRRVVPGIVGDFGPVDELGEANIAMNRALNGLADSEQPKHYGDAKARFQAGRTAVLLLPGSGNVLSRPISGARIAEAGTAALTAFGGAEKLYRCIRDEVDATF